MNKFFYDKSNMPAISRFKLTGQTREASKPLLFNGSSNQQDATVKSRKSESTGFRYFTLAVRKIVESVSDFCSYLGRRGSQIKEYALNKLKQTIQTLLIFFGQIPQEDLPKPPEKVNPIVSKQKLEAVKKLIGIEFEDLQSGKLPREYRFVSDLETLINSCKGDQKDRLILSLLLRPDDSPLDDSPQTLHQHLLQKHAASVMNKEWLIEALIYFNYYSPHKDRLSELSSKTKNDNDYYNYLDHKNTFHLLLYNDSQAFDYFNNILNAIENTTNANKIDKLSALLLNVKADKNVLLARSAWKARQNDHSNKVVSIIDKHLHFYFASESPKDQFQFWQQAKEESRKTFPGRIDQAVRDHALLAIKNWEAQASSEEKSEFDAAKRWFHRNYFYNWEDNTFFNPGQNTLYQFFIEDQATPPELNKGIVNAIQSYIHQRINSNEQEMFVIFNPNPSHTKEVEWVAKQLQTFLNRAEFKQWQSPESETNIPDKRPFKFIGEAGGKPGVFHIKLDTADPHIGSTLGVFSEIFNERSIRYGGLKYSSKNQAFVIEINSSYDELDKKLANQDTHEGFTSILSRTEWVDLWA